MNNLQKILCPIDFSETSETLVKYAISFGRAFHVQPEIIHVSTKPPDVYYRFFPDFPGYVKKIEEDSQFKLQEFLQKINVNLKTTIRYGTVYHEILQYAQDEQMDLVIMAANEHSMNETLRLGTTTLRVIRKSECPVLTVFGGRKDARIKNVLLALDLSYQSYQGLHPAAFFARKFNAKLYILHTVEIHEFEKQKAGFEENYEKLSRSLKEEITIPEELRDIEIEKVICFNLDVAQEIVRFAAEKKIDLIVMMSHGRGYLPRVLLGSVTEKVVQTSPCPIITLRVKS